LARKRAEAEEAQQQLQQSKQQAVRGGKEDAWEEAQDVSTGRTYYYNRSRRQSRWVKPSDALAIVQ
jgi:hypothetical protein